MSRLESRQLRYFVAVAEELHFGKAAKRLHMSQPPLSQQIRLIESQLGVTLFDRDQRNVRLLPAGEVLLDQARSILNELERTVELVQATERGERGLLRLGYTAASAYTLIPALIRAFKQRHPHVEVALQEMLSGDMVAALVQHRLDVALMRPVERHAQVQQESLVREPLVLALPADHPLAAKSTTSIAAQVLEGIALIGFTAQGARYLQHQVDLLLGAADVQPRIVQRATQPHTLLSLVSAGLGVAIVPGSSRQIPVDGVVFRDIRLGAKAGPAPQTDIQMAWRIEDERRLVKNFLSIATEVVNPPSKKRRQS